MPSLHDYLKKWALSDPSLITETITGHIYKVRDKNANERTLKILKPTSDDDEKNNATFLALCTGAGAGTVSVFEHDTHALLMDFIDGADLKALCAKGRDDEATTIIAHIINTIHAIPIPQKHPFMNLNERFVSLFNHPANAPDIIKRGAIFARALLKRQSTPVMLHGDIHHENIMHHAKHGWIAIDPKGLVGDPAYDCANTLKNPYGMPERTENPDRLRKQVQILEAITGIDQQKIINYAFAHSCLALCWYHDEDGHYPESIVNTAQILENWII